MTTLTTEDPADPSVHEPPAAPAGCQPLANALSIPLGLLTPSPLNPRKRWDATRVAAMSVSLRQNGQVAPIRVRRNPQATPTNGRAPYEIVAGETRWRAAPDAGLGALDAIVGDYTNQQVIELSLAENTQRRDLHPLEEADAYAALLRQPDGLQGYPTVQALAAHVGASASYVYQRLKLRALCAAGREAFLAGQIDASVALLIARMPDASEQARATARILAGWGGEPYTFKQAAEFLQKEFMLRLQLARFDTTATYRVAGPCAACPKRSGAEPDLFADVTAGDMCQDARCYAAKGTEAHLQLIDTARQAGRTVLQGKAAQAAMLSPDYLRLDEPPRALSDTARPLVALLGDAYQSQIVVADLGEDKAVVELLPAAVAAKAIKARGLLRQQTAGTQKPSPNAKGSGTTADTTTPSAASPVAGTSPRGVGDEEAEGAEEGEEAAATGRGEGAPTGTPPKAGTQARRAAAAAAEDEADKQDAWDARKRRFGRLVAERLNAELARVDDLGIEGLRLAVEILADDMPGWALALLAQLRGWVEPDVDEVGYLVWHPRVAQADGRELAELLVLLTVVGPLSEGVSLSSLQEGDDVTRIAAAYGLFLPALWYDSQAATAANAGSAAGAARRGQDATEVFIAQHGGPQQEQAVTPWPYPKEPWDKPGRDDQKDEGATDDHAG